MLAGTHQIILVAPLRLRGGGNTNEYFIYKLPESTNWSKSVFQAPSTKANKTITPATGGGLDRGKSTTLVKRQESANKNTQRESNANGSNNASANNAVNAQLINWRTELLKNPERADYNDIWGALKQSFSNEGYTESQINTLRGQYWNLARGRHYNAIIDWIKNIDRTKGI